ncbi:MAG: NAD(P)/FAD-dependent oxidoreductase [Peptococcaceae bacterium]|nr:MAG: NAD(P)/FAD-dependent oxidoreductase [Peptococcaceae bacterium]
MRAWCKGKKNQVWGVKKVRYVIIGNSAAGIKAAETLRKLDRGGLITVISEEPGPAYSRCLLPGFLAGTRHEDELRIRPENFYQWNLVDTIFGKKAVKVETGRKQVILADDRRVNYDKLLVATGSSTAFPPVEGLAGPGVLGLRNLADAKEILEYRRKARRVVVIGAGFVGLEAAYALYRRGLEVTVVEKMPHILPLQLDRPAAEIIQRDMQAEGIRFILGAGVREIAGPSLWTRLFGKTGRGVILDNGDRLKAEIVIVATGIKPNVDLVRDTEIKLNRGIVVDQYMRTAVPDVYAAGDVAETEDIITGVVCVTPIWPNAVTQGAIAACNMAGRPRLYTGLIGMQNAVEFRDVPAISMGITQPPDSSYEVLALHHPERNLYRKLVLKNDVIVGMILVGDIRQAGVIAALMRKKANACKFKERILKGEFHHGYLQRIVS